MAGNDSNEMTSSVNALQTRENAALLNEVHDMEDRIDIASMEIEDLEDYCAMVAGEIQSLRGRLEKSPDFKEASDRKFEPCPENSLETSADVKVLADPSSDEKLPDILSGDSAENLPEYRPESSGVRDGSVWEANTGGNVLDPFASAEEEDKRKPRPDKGKKKKKHQDESEDAGQKNGPETEKTAQKEPEPIPVTPAYRALMREPDEIEPNETGPESAEDGMESTPEPEEPAEKTEKDPPAPEMHVTEPQTAENGTVVNDAPDTPEKKRRFSLRGRQGRKRNIEKIYCPNCGSFVGEERKCPWCGSKVK